MPLRLVVGLGNPGSKYAQTRHNVGFRLLDLLLPQAKAWKRWKDLGMVGEMDAGSERIYCIRPLTFMNLSGQAVGDFSKFYRIAASEILICYDDFALNLGQIRIRARGSAGGHNGMESIISVLGTEEIPRLRIGVGPLPPGKDAVQFVLEAVDSRTDSEIDAAVERAAEAVRMIETSGLEAAMNKYNAGSPAG